MIEIVTEEHSKLIKSLFTKTNDSIRIISPFLSKDTAVLFCDAARKGVDCSFVTRFYLQDFVDGSNSIEGIQMMIDSSVKVYALIALHTKLYLFGKSDAIVGSANFTNGGLLRNVELSLHFNNEEHVLKELEDYFEEIRSKIELDPDGRITQEMLDDMKDRYTKQKEKKKQPGDTNYTVFMRGAALDRKAKSVKDNTGDAIAEIKNHIDERKDDVVFIALGGSRDDISYKTPQNIILKFSASAKKRADGNKPMDMHSFIDGGKSVYISNFSEARKNSAKSVEDGDETFFCVHSYDKNGKESPLIVGKGFFRKYNSNNDARKKDWITQFKWLTEYPIYCVISEAKVINAPVNCGIPLREMIDALGYKTYLHTRDNPEKYPKEKVAKAHGQQAMLALTPEAKDYLDKRLEELGKQYGWVNYKSET